MKRYLAWIFSLVLIAGLLCGCGAGTAANEAGSAAPAMKGEYAADMDVMESPEILADSVTSNSTTHTPEIGISQKLVRKLRIEAETEDLDALLSQIDQQVSELGGYCENREVYNGSPSNTRRYRHATLVIRIPDSSMAMILS